MRHEELLRRILDGRWSVEEEQEHITAWGLTWTDLSASECVHTAGLTLPNQYSPALVCESGSRRAVGGISQPRSFPVLPAQKQRLRPPLLIAAGLSGRRANLMSCYIITVGYRAMTRT